jgi:Na+/glutamate symporter
VGGPQVVIFLLACSILAFLQNVLGAGVAGLAAVVWNVDGLGHAQRRPGDRDGVCAAL